MKQTPRSKLKWSKAINPSHEQKKRGVPGEMGISRGRKQIKNVVVPRTRVERVNQWIFILLRIYLSAWEIQQSKKGFNLNLNKILTKFIFKSIICI